MQFGMEQFKFPELDVNSFIPNTIPKNLRLGHQIEYVCKQLLDASEKYEVLLHNIPIQKEKQTIGEIDFIIQEIATQQLVHVELTYKFYIIDTEIKDPILQLIGPNRCDAFNVKLAKIKNDQFSLIHTDIGRTTLLKKGINTSNIQQQVCYKAQLFQPYKSLLLDIQPLNSHCIVGYWLRITEFNSAEFRHQKFYVPSKSEWVLDPIKAVEWVTHDAASIAIEECIQHQRSPMLWMKKSETKLEKFFVVYW